MAAKRLIRLGASLDDLRTFPPDARRSVGYQLRRVLLRQTPRAEAELARARLAELMRVRRQRKNGSMPLRMRPASKSLYRDLGFTDPQAENLKGRADLMIPLTEIIERRGLTQQEAAKLLGVTQPRISDLMRGKIDRFSIDGLVEMFGHIGIGVRFVLKPRKKVA